MMITSAIVAWLAASAARVVSVQVQTVGGRTGLAVATDASPIAARAERTGGTVVVSVDAQAPDSAVRPPLPLLPIHGLSFEESGGVFRVRLDVPADVAYTVRSEGNRVLVLFGNEPTVQAERSAAPTAPPRTTADLYASLFPQTDDTGVEALPASGVAYEEDLGGFTRLHLRPLFAVEYVNGVNAFNDDTTVTEGYYAARFGIASLANVGLGRLETRYSLLLPRRGSTPASRSPTHTFDATFKYPLTERVNLTVTEHYARSRADVRQVDPGREYFFGLGRFTRNDLQGVADVLVGPRLRVAVGAERNRVTFSEQTSFFSYTQDRAHGDLVYDLGERTELRAIYAHGRIPGSPDRPIIESTSDSGILSLSGDILPLLRGSVRVGFETQHSPRAAAEIRTERTVTANAELVRDLRPDAAVRFTFDRSLRLSAFEQNPFYRSTAVRALLNGPLPLGLSLQAGTGYHRNVYPLSASRIGAPRLDTIVEWSAGVGRSLFRWAFVRVDYLHERRRSNVPNLSNTTHSLTAQLGLQFAPLR
jgi:hypothetical protein